MSHFITHLVNFKPVIVLNNLLPLTVFSNELSPFLLGDQVCFIDDEEENEDETTCSLNIAKNFDCVNDPVFNIKLSVMVLSRGIKKVSKINHEADQS